MFKNRDMKKESIKVRFKRWWMRFMEKNSSKKEATQRGVNANDVKGHGGVSNTLDKLNRK